MSWPRKGRGQNTGGSPVIFEGWGVITFAVFIITEARKRCSRFVSLFIFFLSSNMEESQETVQSEESCAYI